MTRINALNGYGLTSTGSCVWCHPTGAHTGDQSATPADLVDGAATHFLTINGAADSGETVAQAGSNVTCAGVNCHYNTTPPAADWYGGAVARCTYCHADGVAAYAAGQLPNAHTQHVGKAWTGNRC